MSPLGAASRRESRRPTELQELPVKNFTPAKRTDCGAANGGAVRLNRERMREKKSPRSLARCRLEARKAGCGLSAFSASRAPPRVSQNFKVVVVEVVVVELVVEELAQHRFRQMLWRCNATGFALLCFA